MTDSQVLELTRRAKNAAKFERLWTGDTSEYLSHSEADLALLGKLAFYTQDASQLDRLFRQSGLYRAKIWDEKLEAWEEIEVSFKEVFRNLH